MAGFGRFNSIQLNAGADLSASGSQYKAVVVAGTIAANSLTAIGLVQNKPKANEDAQVAYEGHMKGVAGAAITAGARVMVTTSGYLIAATSGNIPIGKALAAAASGALVEGLFDFRLAGTISF